MNKTGLFFGVAVLAAGTVAYVTSRGTEAQGGGGGTTGGIVIFTYIYDAQTNKPVANATVNVAGQTKTTDSTGNVPNGFAGISAGQYTMTVSAQGYTTANYSITVASNIQNQYFGAALTPTGTTSPPTGSTTIHVFVSDSGTDSPISGAQVSVNSAIQTTDSSGVTQFTNMGTGTYTVTVSAQGYITINNSITIPDTMAGKTVSWSFQLLHS